MGNNAYCRSVMVATKKRYMVNIFISNWLPTGNVYKFQGVWDLISKYIELKSQLGHFPSFSG